VVGRGGEEETVYWSGSAEAAMRTAELEDAATVAEVVRAACAASGAEGYPLSGAGETAAAVRHDMRHKEVYLLCLAPGGPAVGTLRLHVPLGADYLYVTRVAVHPDWQRRGFAGRLLAFAEAEARRRGLRAVRLDTPGGHSRLVRFYQRYGFEPAGEATLPGRSYASLILERGLAIAAPLRDGFAPALDGPLA
jgi:ribosomal protein S18 acetylase RimI-like enzyme